MSKMKMPGFTAESSLYRTSTHYNIVATKLLVAEANILPQVIRASHPNSQMNKICQNMADLINECFDEGKYNFDKGYHAEAFAWDTLGAELLERTQQKCNVSVEM